MLPDERRLAEAVHNAVEAVRAGVPPDEAARALPAEHDRALLATAADLLEAGEAPGDGPSASFVLGLEEQLRTDLRLGVGRRAPRSRARRALGPGLIVALAGLLFLGVTRSAGDPLGGARRAWDALRGRVAAALVGQPYPTERYFELGRRRLDDVGRAVADGRMSDEQMAGLLADMVDLYRQGADEAVRANTPSAVARARAEVDAAGVELVRLEGLTDEPTATVLRSTHARLESLLAPLVPSATAPAATQVAAATAAPATSSPAATSTLAPATATQAPPEATPTQVPASPTPSPTSTAVASPTSEPPRPERPRPQPSTTPVPTAGPGGPVAPPTATVDKWPATPIATEPAPPSPPAPTSVATDPPAPTAAVPTDPPPKPEP